MLVNAYSKKVFNLAYQFAGSYEEAEDMTQDIFFKLHSSIEKYDFEKNIRMSKQEIKEEFDKQGIEIPFPHRTIYTGSITEPFPVKVVS